METFVLAVLTPLAPAALWLGREIRRNTHAFHVSHLLYGRVESLLNNTVAGRRRVGVIEEETRDIQQELLEFRRSSPLIPDWFYRLARRSQEDTARAAIETIVRSLEERSSV
jgi:hypothetical protein